MAEALAEPEVVRRSRRGCAARPSGRARSRPAPRGPAAEGRPWCAAAAGGRAGTRGPPVARSPRAPRTPRPPSAARSPVRRSRCHSRKRPRLSDRGAISTVRQPGGCRAGGLVAKAVRQPALGLELLEVGLHHDRRRPPELRRDVVPGGVEEPGAGALAGSSAATSLRSRSGGASMYSLDLRRRVGHVRPVAGAEQLEVELAASGGASRGRRSASRRRAARRSSPRRGQVAGEADPAEQEADVVARRGRAWGRPRTARPPRRARRGAAPPPSGRRASGSAGRRRARRASPPPPGRGDVALVGGPRVDHVGRVRPTT